MLTDATVERLSVQVAELLKKLKELDTPTSCEADLVTQHRGLIHQIVEFNELRKLEVDKNAEIQTLRQRIGVLEKTNETLLASSNAARKDCEKLENKILELNSDRNRVDSYAKALETHISNLINMPEKSRDLVYVLRSQKSLELQLEERNRDMERLRAQYRTDYEAEIRRLNTQYNEEIQKQTLKHEQELIKCSDRESSLVEEVASLKDELLSLRSGSSVADFKLNRLEEERTLLMGQLQSSEKKIEYLTTRVSEMNDGQLQLLYELSRCKSEVEYNKGQLERESARTQELNGEIRNVTEERNSLLMERVPKLEIQLTDLLTSRSSLQEHLADLQKENAIMIETQKHLEENVRRLSTNTESGRDSINEYIDKHLTDINKLRTRVEELTAEKAQLLSKISKLEATLRDAECELADLRVSVANKNANNNEAELIALQKEWDAYKVKTREEILVLQQRMREEAASWEKELRGEHARELAIAHTTQADRIQAEQESTTRKYRDTISQLESELEDSSTKLKCKEAEVESLEKKVWDAQNGETQSREEFNSRMIAATNEITQLKHQCEALRRSQLHMRKMLNQRGGSDESPANVRDSLKNVLRPALTLALVEDLRRKRSRLDDHAHIVF